MKKKLTLSILIIIIISVFIIYYNNHSVLISKQPVLDSKQPLLTYNYEISTDGNFKNVYLITSDKKNLNFLNNLVKENELLEITIPKNNEFIISLHANKTMDAKWNLEHNSNILKFQTMDWIELNEVNHSDKSTGNSTARQYFYFTSKNEGSEVLTFVYKHNTENEQYFKFSIKVTV